MPRSRDRRSPLLLALVAVLASAALLAACGSDGATVSADRPGGTGDAADGSGGSFAPYPEGCVTVPTTVPGMVFCQDYDPAADLASQTPQPVVECPTNDPVRPEVGWLGDDPGSQPRIGGEVAIEPGAADELAAKAAAQLGEGYVVAEQGAWLSSICPVQLPVRWVTLDAPGGGTVYVVTYQLTTSLYWFEEPVSGDLVRSTLPDGTEVAVNDFAGEGVYHRAWVARPDGTYLKVVASGADAPSQGGWPTMPPTTAPVPPGGPAPLTLGEAQALALALLP